VSAPSFDATFPDLASALDTAGLGLRGVLAIEGYDARVPPPWRSAVLLPDARAAVVIGAGGRALWRAFRRAPESSLAVDPLDAWLVRLTQESVAALAARGVAARAVHPFETRAGVFADFVALGAAAGLGVPSRLGLLVHPSYGPWLSLRALLLVDACLAPTPALADFAPCDGCAAPCASACHGDALAGARFDVAACGAARRREPACLARCDARRSCVVGREHAYDAQAEAHHMRAALPLVLARAAEDAP